MVSAALRSMVLLVSSALLRVMGLHFFVVHQYINNGYSIILDVNSGSVHVLDDAAYQLAGLIDETMSEECPQQLFDKLSNIPEDELRTAYQELYALKQAGQLFADDDYIDVSRYIPTDAPVKALCLHVAHDCNLRCNY